ALAALETDGHLAGVVTQNTDGLHREAGTKTLIELHGNGRTVRCLDCGAGEQRAAVQARLGRELPPRCETCGGIHIKPGVFFCGGALPAAAVAEAFRLARRCDLMLVVGTSLQVYPAADVPRAAVERAVPLVIVNDEPTPLDAAAAVVIRGRSGEVLPEIVRRSSRPFRGTRPRLPGLVTRAPATTGRPATISDPSDARSSATPSNVSPGSSTRTRLPSVSESSRQAAITSTSEAANQRVISGSILTRSLSLSMFSWAAPEGAQCRLIPVPTTHFLATRSTRMPPSLRPSSRRSLGHFSLVRSPQAVAAATPAAMGARACAGITQEARKALPGGASQRRPRRPRPSVWCSARTTVPT